MDQGTIYMLCNTLKAIKQSTSYKLNDFHNLRFSKLERCLKVLHELMNVVFSEESAQNDLCICLSKNSTFIFDKVILSGNTSVLNRKVRLLGLKLNIIISFKVTNVKLTLQGNMKHPYRPICYDLQKLFSNDKISSLQRLTVLAGIGDS